MIAIYLFLITEASLNCVVAAGSKVICTIIKLHFFIFNLSYSNNVLILLYILCVYIYFILFMFVGISF